MRKKRKREVDAIEEEEQQDLKDLELLELLDGKQQLIDEQQILIARQRMLLQEQAKMIEDLQMKTRILELQNEVLSPEERHLREQILVQEYQARQLKEGEMSLLSNFAQLREKLWERKENPSPSPQEQTGQPVVGQKKQMEK